MNTLLAILIGALAGTSVYCLLRRSLMKLIIGIALLGQSVNLLVFGASGLKSNKPPIIDAADKTLQSGTTDPLPQALVLTAIVIGFGLIAFSLALIYQTYQATGEDDINAFNKTDTKNLES